jgi:hypothetical protein
MPVIVPVVASSKRLQQQEALSASSCRDMHICYKPDGITGHARYWYNKRTFPPRGGPRKTHGECMVGCFTQEMASQMGFETCGKACPAVPPKRTTLHFGRRFTCPSCYHMNQHHQQQQQQQQQQQHDVL